MAVASHLERRGVVYYWRRRLPDFLAQRVNQQCVVVSLRTRELKSARYLTAQLNAAVEKMLVLRLGATCSDRHLLLARNSRN